MINKAMQRKLASGNAIDVSFCKKTEDGSYILERFEEDIDYCDSKTESWIWSIGKRYSDGVILARTDGNLYQNPDFECLWLR